MAMIAVNGECKHALTCQKINERVEAAATNGRVVRLITNVDTDDAVTCQACKSFEKTEVR